MLPVPGSGPRTCILKQRNNLVGDNQPMPFFETRVIRSLPFLIVLFLVGFRDQEINAIDLAVVNANVITMDEALYYACDREQVLQQRS